MIELTRKQIQQIRSTFRQALGITTARRAPDVTLRTTPDGLLIQSTTDTTAIEYRVEGDHPPEVITIPYEALKACEGRRDEPVRFTRNADSVTVEWTDAGIPQVRDYPTSDREDFPAEPKQLSPIDKSFIKAMADAVATTDKESTRYALSCVRLRGSDGQMAATDGRQALIQNGFVFPWDDEVLMPACGVFNSKAFRDANVASIGRSEEWVTVRVGAWTLHSRIETKFRFPHVDDQIPTTTSSATTLSLSDNDAEYLQQAVKRLPAAKEFNAPVTVDLNGAVVLRAKATDQQAPTELVLSNSARHGAELRFNSNRAFLSRAAELGFREVYLRDAESPAYCRDGHRSYIWALLGKDGALKPNANATRIESPVASTKPKPQNRISIPMKQTTQPSDTSTQNDQPVSILSRAEALRDSLTQTLSDTRELIAAIKHQRKQDQLVKSTLRSLKQLENIGA